MAEARKGREVFRHRDYTLYVLSRFLWGLGVQIMTVAVGWLVYSLTSDPFALGLVGLAAFIPAVPLPLRRVLSRTGMIAAPS